MDTMQIMLEHIKARILRIRSCYVDQNMVSSFDKERLDELGLMLEVLRNANNLARLAQEIKQMNQEAQLNDEEPTITFEGAKPK